MGVWGYIFSYLFTIAGGIVIGMLIDSDNVYKTTIRKIKQKGRGNTLESELEVNLPIQTKSEAKKQVRKKRKNDNKLARKAKRLEKKL